MDSPIDINQFKTDKKNKIIVEDLTDIVKILSLTITALNMFKKYKPVQTLIIALENERRIINLTKEKLSNEDKL